MKLDDLNLFRFVVEHGSYTAASKKHQIPVATLTRRIQALEESLNIRLLNRDARKLSLTEAGMRFYQDCSPILQQLSDTTDSLTEECKGASGKLKISAPSNIALHLIQPMLNAFMAKYPDIQINLLLSNQFDPADCAEQDAVFRIGPQRDSNLIARRIHKVRDVLLASPAYLTNKPALHHAQDLHQHMLLKGAPLLRWRLVDQHQEVFTVNDHGRFEASEFNVILSACKAGLGIALMPDILVKDDIDSGNLIQVLPEWSSNARDIYLLYNHKDNQPEKLKIFIEFANNFFVSPHKI